MVGMALKVFDKFVSNLLWNDLDIKDKYVQMNIYLLYHGQNIVYYNVVILYSMFYFDHHETLVEFSLLQGI